MYVPVGCLFKLSSEIWKMWHWHVSVGCLFKLSSQTWKNMTLTCAYGLLSVQTVLWDLKQCVTDMCLWVVSVWTVVSDFETCKTDMCLWVVSVQTCLRFGKMWHGHVPVDCLFKVYSEICKNVTLTCACGLLSVHTVLWDLEKCDTHMCLWVTCLFRPHWGLKKCDICMCLWVVVCSDCPEIWKKKWHRHVPVFNDIRRLYPGALKKVRLACAFGLLSVQSVLGDVEKCDTDMCLWIVVCSNCFWDLEKHDIDMCLCVVCSNCPLRFENMWHRHVPVFNRNRLYPGA